jgi:SAM-dependent methyltransferase
MLDEIRLLAPELLDEEPVLDADITRLSRALRIGLGWHYRLDLAWILRGLDLQPGATVLDAGAGYGVLQWYLSDQGINVISVDRMDRAAIPLRFRIRYPVRGLVPADAPSLFATVRREVSRGAPLLDVGRYVAAARERVGHPQVRAARGLVSFHRADLGSLHELPDESVDQVVAVSALEHNEPDHLPAVVGELMRVLRPGGSILATLGASAGEDWFHAPSKGWCYGEGSLLRAFDLPAETPSNYGEYGQIMAAVRDSAELRDNLASFYFRSGNNGMPWGRWDPAYLSVGVRKTKAVGSSRRPSS